MSMCCYKLIALYLYIIELFPLAYPVIHALLLTFSHPIAYLINALRRFLNRTRPLLSLGFDRPDPSLCFCARFDSVSHAQADCKYFDQIGRKQSLVVCASTGFAASNISGYTLHSLCSFKFNSEDNDNAKYYPTQGKAKKNSSRSLGKHRICDSR